MPSSEVSVTEPLDKLTLVPYGAAKLRITVFPVAALSNVSDAVVRPTNNQDSA